ncbi:MAG: hypothetical protein NZ959_00185 [Armatimonadetes bacterium]|nr:hypothetical protein [Armatimonadota bacterium]MDW8120731.1 hypothetical protein [Armatimonadota bacterium]
MDDLRQLWDRVKPIIRRRMMLSPDAWRSIDQAIPIALEGDLLVLGLTPENENLRPYLEAEGLEVVVRTIFKELIGKEVGLSVIVGSTVEDWERHKARMEMVRRLEQRGEVVGARVTREGEKDWRWLLHQLSSAYASLQQRQLDYVKGQFTLEIAERVAEFEEEYLSRHPMKEADLVKELERICQRVAGMVNLPPSAIAVEIERVRRARKQRVSPS